MTPGTGFDPPAFRTAISVVVATRNRALSLDRLLSALAVQVGPPPFEVVVGDNGSSDETSSVIERTGRPLRVRAVRVDRPGKGRTLNAALREAEGDLLVFTDDDVRPEPDWLAALHDAALRYPEVAVFGGRIEIGSGSVPDWIRRSRKLSGLLASEHDLGEAEVPYAFGDYPFGPNMAIRRRALAGIEAPFREDMGPGTSVPVGDESGFLVRISPPGARDRLYVPGARVAHDVEAPNVTFRAALGRSYSAGFAAGRLAIPAAPPSSNGSRPPLMERVAAQFLASATLREFACVCARHIGHRKGARSPDRAPPGARGSAA